MYFRHPSILNYVRKSGTTDGKLVIKTSIRKRREYISGERNIFMLSIAVCDDNELTAQEISQKIRQYCPVEAEISVFYHTEDILFSIHNKKEDYDIVFMDIEFDVSSGIEAAKQINAWHPDCQIIYITNHTSYFSSVYETSHIFYILKSDIDVYLETALKKAIGQLEKVNQLYLIIHSRQSDIRISQNKILYLERVVRTTNIYTTDGVYQTPEKMDSICERLCPWFCATHRSYVVNGRHIVNLDRHHATLSNDVSIPVSRTCYENVKKTFAKCIWSEEFYTPFSKEEGNH